MGIEFNVQQMLSLFFNYLTLGYLNSLIPDDSVKLKLNYNYLLFGLLQEGGGVYNLP